MGLGGVGGVEDVDVEVIVVVLADGFITIHILPNHQVALVLLALSGRQAVDAVAVGVVVTVGLQSLLHLFEQGALPLGQCEGVCVAAPFQGPALRQHVAFLPEAFLHLDLGVDDTTDVGVHPVLDVLSHVLGGSGGGCEQQKNHRPSPHPP